MKRAEDFKLEVITPERVLLSQQASSLMLLSSEGGSLGIFPNHAPLIAKVNAGILKVRDTNKKEKIIFVSRGVIIVSLEGVSILVRSAETKEMIDRERARAAKERAKKRLVSPDKDVDLQRAREALNRAEYRMKLAGSAPDGD
jgi:F-type H+-transporting ATPase subunit epsilon